jgi:hypothetical protein
MFGVSRQQQQPPGDAFWSWFARAADRAKQFPPPPEFVDAVMPRLQQVHGGLAFQIGRTDHGLVIEISADRNPDLIPVVTELCALAPALPGWTVRAFRQAAGGLAIRTGPWTFSAEQVYFTLERDGADTHLTLFVDGQGAPMERVGWVGMMLVEAMIGELAMMTELTTVDVYDETGCPEGARPLTELSSALDH